MSAALPEETLPENICHTTLQASHEEGEIEKKYLILLENNTWATCRHYQHDAILGYLRYGKMRNGSTYSSKFLGATLKLVQPGVMSYNLPGIFFTIRSATDKDIESFGWKQSENHTPYDTFFVMKRENETETIFFCGEELPEKLPENVSR